MNGPVPSGRSNRLVLEPLEDRRVLAVFTVTHLGDGPVVAPNDLPGSLRQAVYDSNQNTGFDTIRFTNGLAGSVLLNSGELHVQDILFIDGRDASIAIDAQSNSRVFRADDGISSTQNLFRIREITVTGGSALEGGGILNREDLAVVDSVITGNVATIGGGIYSDGVRVDMDGSTISDNRATLYHGGGMYARSYVYVEDATFSSNYAYENGGALHVSKDGRVENAAIENNSTRGRAGGIYVQDADFRIYDSAISGNSVGGFGGTIGGAIASKDARLGVYVSEISNNNGDIGSGIWVEGGSLHMAGSLISGNLGTSAGGGLYLRDTLPSYINYSTISNNETYFGGGILAFNSNLNIRRSILNDNVAGEYGGGLFVGGYSDIDVVNSTVSGNDGAAGGGGVRVDSGYVEIRFSTIANNSADFGGGLQALLNAVHLDHTIIALNDSLYSSNVDGPYTSEYSLVDVDPQLGPLADNGGPTLTHALLPGSLAIDAGSAPRPFDPDTDQRGSPRPGGGLDLFDIGAYESVGSPVAGDFDFDGNLDVFDIDLLVEEIASGANDPIFDLTGDGFVDLADRDRWLEIAGAINLASGAPYLLGDANLDGTVDGLDFIAWNSARFTATPAWSVGDFNADGFVDANDFIIWNDFKFQSADSSLMLSKTKVAERWRDDRPRAWVACQLLLYVDGLDTDDALRKIG